MKDLRRFTILYIIDVTYFHKALCDLGDNINLMSFFVFQKLKIVELKPTTISLHLTDGSMRHLRGMVENVLVKVDKCYFLIDFIVLDMEVD